MSWVDSFKKLGSIYLNSRVFTVLKNTLGSSYYSLHPQVITYNESCMAEDICAAAAKLITFIDLAGHHKYMKTTIFGLTGYFPGAVMLVVGANTGMGEDCRL